MHTPQTTQHNGNTGAQPAAPNARPAALNTPRVLQTAGLLRLHYAPAAAAQVGTASQPQPPPPLLLLLLLLLAAPPTAGQRR